MPESNPNSLQVRPLDDRNRAAVLAFANRHGPVLSPDVQDWRYRHCPTMEAMTAMAGDECVATMFALHRTYHTPSGNVDCLEPFSWHANEDWRAQAPGLRIVKHYMKGPKPLLAVAGTDAAAGLLVRLKWTQLPPSTRYVLPLTGRFVASRGKGALVVRAFDLAGRAFYAPSRPRGTRLTLESAGKLAAAVTDIAGRQRRFALMRLPDEQTWSWLQRAPAAAGHYLAFHARLDNELVGWVTARVFTHEGLRVGELLEVFVDDARRAWYPAVVAKASATLAGFGPDYLKATTTCPDTTAALKALRFRLDDTRPAFAWWGSAPMPSGPVLVDGAISDHAFFPLPSAADSAWLEGSRPQAQA